VPRIITDWITLSEACELLRVSRPTFDKLRVKHKFRERQRGRPLYFSRLELIRKVLIPEEVIGRSSNLIHKSHDIDDLEVAANVFDLRGVANVDEYGAMALLCLLRRRLRDPERIVVVLVSDSTSCKYLKAIGFFDELKRGGSHFFVNDDDIKGETPLPPENILRLQTLGYRGAEKVILDHLYDGLQKQGFSENLCSRLGWTLGELADNAHTHAGGPCFITIVSRPAKPNSPKFLCMSVGDIGPGIPETLKKNPKYQTLSDAKALCMAFKSSVTSWGDEAKRGKGLNDLLAVGKGNQAWVRVESNGMSLFFDFRKEPERWVEKGKSSTTTLGTRFSLVLIDAAFKDVSKEEIDALIDSALEKEV